ncbi:MAG TPA: hypothetical protein VFA97_00415 [Gaiellaceae bacterium]|nr:hypothetical protein [Gaiellaceae bacterium]
MTVSTTVWLAPSATTFSCLCEACLEEARTSGVLFADALMLASVRGTVSADADVSTRRCRAGHELVLRRIERPAGLQRRDERQLQLG